MAGKIVEERQACLLEVIRQETNKMTVAITRSKHYTGKQRERILADFLSCEQPDLKIYAARHKIPVSTLGGWLRKYNSKQFDKYKNAFKDRDSDLYAAIVALYRKSPMYPLEKVVEESGTSASYVYRVLRENNLPTPLEAAKRIDPEQLPDSSFNWEALRFENENVVDGEDLNSKQLTLPAVSLPVPPLFPADHVWNPVAVSTPSIGYGNQIEANVTEAAQIISEVEESLSAASVSVKYRLLRRLCLKYIPERLQALETALEELEAMGISSDVLKDAK